jgi:hypothetical protein
LDTNTDENYCVEMNPMQRNNIKSKMIYLSYKKVAIGSARDFVYLKASGSFNKDGQ